MHGTAMLLSNELKIKCSAPDGDGVHSLLYENSPLYTYLLNMLLVEALHVASPGKPQILRHSNDHLSYRAL